MRRARGNYTLLLPQPHGAIHRPDAPHVDFQSNKVSHSVLLAPANFNNAIFEKDVQQRAKNHSNSLTDIYSKTPWTTKDRPGLDFEAPTDIPHLRKRLKQHLEAAHQAKLIDRDNRTLFTRILALESNRDQPTREWVAGTRLTRNLTPVLDNEAGLAMSKCIGSLSLPARAQQQAEIRRENSKFASAIRNAKSHYGRAGQLDHYERRVKKYRQLSQRRGLRIGRSPSKTRSKTPGRGGGMDGFLSPANSLGARGPVYAQYLCAGSYDTRAQLEIDFEKARWRRTNSTSTNRALARANHYRDDDDDGFSGSDSSDDE